MDRADPNWSQWSSWEGVHHKGRRILKKHVIVNTKFQVLGMWGLMLYLAQCTVVNAGNHSNPAPWFCECDSEALAVWNCVKKFCVHVRKNLKSCGAKILRSLALALRPRQLCRGMTPSSKGFFFSFTSLLGTPVGITQDWWKLAFS